MSRDRYILLHGAIKNVGDFLIFERARALIQAYRSPGEMIELPRWQSLVPHLDLVNRSTAVILCGGPGYAHNFYPDIFPLTPDLAQLKVPVVPLGLGWAGKPGSPNEFQFSPSSEAALQEIHNRIPCSSARDVLTEQILHRAGFHNVVMTGCPAWYHLPTVQMDFQPLATIKRVVVTTPASPQYFIQARGVIDLVSRRFPKSKAYLVFHRGILPDKNKTLRKSILEMGLAIYGKMRGFQVLDASYSARKIDFYAECDLHIGYRVHAHINFLSFRRPSILIQEDGRGQGQSATLETEDVWASDSEALAKLSSILENHLDNQFASFTQPIAIMRQKHAIMQEFLAGF